MKRNNNNRRPKNKSFQKGKDKIKEYDKRADERDVAPPKDGRNDVEWYAQTPALLRDAANYPFSYAAGTTYSFDINNTYTDGSVVSDALHTVPGIMTFYLTPCISEIQSSPTSPVNIAATSMYSFVRHANSGSSNYDSPDLMLYCLAMGQVYSYLNFLQRVYGCMTMYSHMNRYMPRALVRAQGVDYDDVQANLANFRYGINALIHKAASLAVPATMTYFRRLAFLFSNLYAEGESIKSQLYMYSPYGFMQFNETTTGGGSLQHLQFLGQGSTSEELHTVTDLITFGNNLLNPIIESEDMNIMSGDILKAYGSNQILTLQTVPEVIQIIPVTNLAVLEQMQNLNCVGNVTNMSITQSSTNLNGYLVCQVNQTGDQFWKYNAFLGSGSHVLTTILANPEAGDVMERTRGMVVTEMQGTSSAPINVFASGSEICIQMKYTRINPTTLQPVDTQFLQAEGLNSGSPASGLFNLIFEHCALENFKFHPIKYYFEQESDGDWHVGGVAVDFDNYTLIDKNALLKMHEAALLSLFNVASIARAD